MVLEWEAISGQSTEVIAVIEMQQVGHSSDEGKNCWMPLNLVHCLNGDLPWQGEAVEKCHTMK